MSGRAPDGQIGFAYAAPDNTVIARFSIDTKTGRLTRSRLMRYTGGCEFSPPAGRGRAALDRLAALAADPAGSGAGAGRICRRSRHIEVGSTTIQLRLGA